MGNLHGQLTEIMTDTLAEVARKPKVKYNTLWKKAKRKFPAEIWAEDSAVLPEHMAALFPEKSATKKTIIRIPAHTTVNQPAPAENTPTSGRAKFAWPSVGLSEFLALAVYGHTALVWYELWVIFQVPGILAGIVLFALKHAAVVICRAEKYEDYADDALGVAFVLDGLAVWVHYTAFGDAMPDRFKDGAEFWAALVLGLVVAAGAFVTLYFTNKTAKQ